MLTLTRKVGEQIKIGPDIVIEIREIRGRQVRVGVVAPEDLVISRAELDPLLPNPSPAEILAMTEPQLREYCSARGWDFDDLASEGRLAVDRAIAGFGSRKDGGS